MGKKNKTELDDFNIDNFDDGWSGGFDAQPAQDNRSPSTKLSTGIFQGIVEEAKSPTFMKGIVKTALPKEYGSVWDSVDDVTSEGIGLYNDLKKDIRPATRQLKRFMRYVKPKVEPVMPKWFSRRLDDVIRDDSVSSTPTLTQEQIDDSRIATELGAIFKAQTEAQTDDRARETMRDLVDTKRHAASQDSLAAIQENLARLASYQDQVTNAYQRKSLELQYRSYFAQRDLLKLSVETSGKSLDYLQHIMKNTGLPDFVKLNNSEALKEQFRTAITGKIQDSISSGFRPYVRTFFKNLAVSGQQGISEIIRSAQLASDLKENFDQLQQLAADSGEDGTVATGKMVGNMAASGIGTAIGNRIRPHLEKNAELVGKGYELARLRSNIPNIIQRWANTPTTDYGVWGSVLDAVKRAAQVGSKDTEVAQSNITDLMRPGIFTNKAHITLVDIIPGLLARLWQSSEGIRTGEVPDEPRWDWESSKFSTKGKLLKHVASKIFNKRDMENDEWQANAFVDVFADDVFTPTQRDAVKSYLQKRVGEKRSFDVLDFMKASNYSKHASPEDAVAIAKAFAQQLSITEEGKTKRDDLSAQRRHTSLDNIYRNYAVSDNDVLAKTRLYYNLGYRDLVRELNILENDRGVESLKRDKVNEVFSNYRNRNQDHEKVIDTLLAQRHMDDSSNIGRRDSSANVVTNDANLSRAASGNEVATKDVADGIFARLRSHFFSGSDSQASAATQQVAIDENVLTPHVDRVVEAINAASSKTTSVDILHTLTQMLDVVKNIGSTGSGGGTGGNEGNPSGKPGFMRRAARMGWKGVKKGFGAGWNLNKKLFGWGVGLAKLPFKAIGWMAGKVKNKIIDVYVPGKQEPAITAEGIKAGHYFDLVTNKVITSLADIKGAVVRRITGQPDEVVLTAQQFKDGLYDATWKPIKAGLGKFLDTAWGFGKRAVGMGFKPASWAWSSLKWVKDKITASPDIFVPGESSPRIIGKLLDAGNVYFDTAGKPLTGIGGIKTDVFHKDDPKKPVLYYSEFVNGVVDYNGKPIRTLGDRAMGLAKLPFKLAGSALGAIKKGVLWSGEKIGGLFSGMFGGLGGGFSGMNFGFAGKASTRYQIENINVLKRIYNLLCERFDLGEPMELTPSDGDDGPKGPGFFAGAKQGFKRGMKKWRRTKRIRDNLKEQAKQQAASTWDSTKKRVDDKLKEHGLDKHIDKARLSIDGTVEKFVEKRKAVAERMNEAYSGEDGLKRTLGRVRKGVTRRMAKDRKEKGEDYGTLDKLKSLFGSLKDQTKSSKRYKSLKERITERTDAEKQRKGSFAYNLAALREAKKKAADAGHPEKKSEKESGGGGFGMMALLAIANTLTGIWGTVKTIGAAVVAAKAAGGVADALGDAADMAGGKDGKPNKGGKPKKGGLLRKMGRGLWNVGKGLFTVGAWGVRAGMWAAGALASAVSAPVVLGAAVVAGVAVAGYYTYKYFKGQISPLNKLRLAQYGVDLEDKDACTKVTELERILTPAVKWEGNKPVNIVIDKSLGLKILDVIGVDSTNTQNVKVLSDWYEGRFKPVFLSNLAAMKLHDLKCDLVDVDTKLPAAAKYAYAQKTMLSTWFGGPYYVNGFNLFPNSTIQRGTGVIDKLLEEIRVANDPKAKPTVNPVGNAPKKDTKTQQEKDLEAMNQRVASMSNEKVTGIRSQAEYYMAAKKKDEMAKKIATPNSPMIPTTPPPEPKRTVQDTVRASVDNVGASALGGRGVYASIPVPTGDGYVRVAPTITAAADAVGVDNKMALAMAGIESSYRNTVKAGTSSAKGLFQFTNTTWREQMDKHAEKHGIPKNATPYDPVANSLLGAEYLKANSTELSKTLGRPVNETEMYLAHFLGLGGAKKFLTANKQDIAARVLPAASSSNESIFFDGSRPRTIGEVYSLLESKVNKAKSVVVASHQPGSKIDLSTYKMKSTERQVAPEQVQDIPRVGPKPQQVTPDPVASAVQASATEEPPKVAPKRESEVAKRLSAQDQRDRKRNEVAAQQQIARSEAVNTSIGSVKTVLDDSLEVQRSMASSLTAMVELLSKRPEVATNQASANQSRPTEAPPAIKPMTRNL